MKPAANYLDISLARQELSLIESGVIKRVFPVSTAKNGAGQRKGSFCTPLGWHCIRAKIGAAAPLAAVFVGRRPTGEIYSPDLAAQHPQRDWILTRILWLSGLEPGKNRYGAVDSGSRYIYIHGSPDHLIDGVPDSHGCVRMHNADVTALFELVSPGCRVYIHE
ncbi:L,D-transpeptidase [Methylomonas paludis]|uniref:L,D-transpeptidase n=1 Tax=Methylomonas paludis TaxID=1173101 RepID=A0A975MKL6_9GAMM|nr:L,D-transpeptidase [Methylomonas paludis]QWF69535.1 L,D-transpeptidase [Methylomonas paludis]